MIMPTTIMQMASRIYTWVDMKHSHYITQAFKTCKRGEDNTHGRQNRSKQIQSWPASLDVVYMLVGVVAGMVAMPSCQPSHGQASALCLS